LARASGQAEVFGFPILDQLDQLDQLNQVQSFRAIRATGCTSFPSFKLDIFLGLSTDMPRYAPSWVFSEVMARSISKALANPKAKHGESALTAVTWPKILKNNGVPATNSQWSINGVWKVKVIRYKLIMIYDYYD